MTISLMMMKTNLLRKGLTIMGLRVYALVIVVSFSGGYLLAMRQSTTKETKISQQYEAKLKEVSNHYEEKIASIQLMQDMSHLYKTNEMETIVKTEHTKPTGERSFTEIVKRARQVHDNYEEKAVNSLNVVGVFEDVTGKSFNLEESKDVVIKEKEHSSVNYIMLGLSKSKVFCQENTVNNLTDNLSIQGGIKIYKTPVFITTSIPLSMDKYKQAQVGFTIIL